MQTYLDITQSLRRGLRFPTRHLGLTPQAIIFRPSGAKPDSPSVIIIESDLLRT